MTKLRLKYVHRFRDRHGKVRHYFRRRGFKDQPLPGLPGSEEFMTAYQAALSGDTAPPLAIGATRSKPGTVAALVAAYFGSAAFLGLAPSSQATYRNIIERFRADHGEKRVALIKRRHIAIMLGKKAGTPGAANSWLKKMRGLMRFAMEQDLIREDPTLGVVPVRSRSDGFHTWSEEEIATYAAHHAPGTPARLALALLLYTGQRRSDVVKMGRQHVRKGVLSIRQQKTGNMVDIPIHPDLQAILDQLPADDLTYLRTSFRKPFTSPGFGNWFRARCNEAKLPKHCSAHGLRKAASRRLAEAGCTANEIAAITGHQSLREVERYTRASDRKGLADRAMKKLKDRT